MFIDIHVFSVFPYSLLSVVATFYMYSELLDDILILNFTVAIAL